MDTKNVGDIIKYENYLDLVKKYPKLNIIFIDDDHCIVMNITSLCSKDMNITSSCSKDMNIHSKK